jgi:uncharacterized protein YbjT (DUF2867 family)
MKIVVIGGTGLIGSKLLPKLRAKGHEAVAASPQSGVDILTGAGLAAAFEGASTVVDVSNSPSFEAEPVMKFFTTSTPKILAQEAASGVRHHVALSVVGTERLPDSPYLRAKLAQERLIEAGTIPYSIVHATQFFEFLKGIADAATEGTKVHVPPVLFQPMAAEDVATALADVVTGKPLMGRVEIGGPERLRFDAFIQRSLDARKDPRVVLPDPHARYFGTELSERSLVPDDGARLGTTRFETWVKTS